VGLRRPCPRRTLGRKLHQLAEVDFARACCFKALGIARKHDNFFDALQSIESFIDDALQRNRLAAAESGIANNDNPGTGIFYAIA